MKAVLLAIAILFATDAGAQVTALPHTTCARSETWTRPSPEVQSAIWNDPRYTPSAHTAFEWTHDFLLTEPDSASLGYHSANLAGLWTVERAICPRRDGEHGEWIEMWVLGHRVRRITAEAGLITVAVDRRDAGFEIVQFKRPPFPGEAHVRVRVVAGDGTVAQEWVEAGPGLFDPRR